MFPTSPSSLYHQLFSAFSAQLYSSGHHYYTDHHYYLDNHQYYTDHHYYLDNHHYYTDHHYPNNHHHQLYLTGSFLLDLYIHIIHIIEDIVVNLPPFLPPGHLSQERHQVKVPRNWQKSHRLQSERQIFLHLHHFDYQRASIILNIDIHEILSKVV